MPRGASSSKYFNKVFELWGRKVKFVEYESEYGNSTERPSVKGKEGACADADSIIAKYKPFLVFGAGATGVFGECAGEQEARHVRRRRVLPGDVVPEVPPVPVGRRHGVRAHRVSERRVHRQAGREPSGEVGEGALKNKPRKIGIYVPNNDQYQPA